MKYTTVIFLFFSCISYSQNLVPNPSFEEHTGCYVLDEDCSDWFSFKATPDYINGCSGNGFDNGAGFQLPHTGDAYAGFISYTVNLPNPNPSVREHFGVQLTDPMIIGEKYYVSFYVSAGYTPTSFDIATNNLGALFTTYTYYSLWSDIPNPNFAHINETAIITDTLNWTKISGSLIADSAYTYIIIGNFYDDIYTDTLNFSNLYPTSTRNAYYFVDDICVSTDSAYCENWTGTAIKKFLPPKVNCYPNPVRDVLHITSDQPLNSFELRDHTGKIILTSNNHSKNTLDIIVKDLPSGIYFLRINTPQSNYSTKIIINEY